MEELRFVGMLEQVVKLAKKTVRVRFVWFDAPLELPKTDILRLRQMASLPTGAKGRLFTTLVHDLTLSEQDLWQTIDRDTQYEIRRAEREGVAVRFMFVPSSACIDRFIGVHDSSQSRERWLPPVNRQLLSDLAAEQSLAISHSHRDGDSAFSSHAYVVKAGRARLLYSVSHFHNATSKQDRQFAGRANRYHCWQDVKAFREQGLLIFDWGGWYEGQQDSRRAGINSFKQGFGGTRERRFDADLAISFRGRVVLCLWNMGSVILEYLRKLGKRNKTKCI